MSLEWSSKLRKKKKKRLEKLEINRRIESIQIQVLLTPTRILFRVSKTWGYFLRSTRILFRLLKTLGYSLRSIRILFRVLKTWGYLLRSTRILFRVLKTWEYLLSLKLPERPIAGMWKLTRCKIIIIIIMIIIIIIIIIIIQTTALLRLGRILRRVSRPENTCYNLDLRERPNANAGMWKLTGSKIIMIIIIALQKVRRCIN